MVQEMTENDESAAPLSIDEEERKKLKRKFDQEIESSNPLNVTDQKSAKTTKVDHQLDPPSPTIADPHNSTAAAAPQNVDIDEGNVLKIKSQNAVNLLTAMDEALQVHLITDKIVPLLSYSDLKSCRLVQKGWIRFATMELKKRSKIIHLEFNEGVQKYMQLRRWKSGRERQRKSLDDLSDLVGTTTLMEFPITSFTFESGNFDSYCTQRFFSLYGPSIERLVLIVADDPLGRPEDKSIIRNILLNQAPNVETLKVSCCNVQWDKSDRFELPNLKILLDATTTLEMLSAAPKLEEIHNFTLDCLDSPIFLHDKNYDKIKSWVCRGNNKDFRRIEQFSIQKPQLTSFSFGYWQSVVMEDRHLDRMIKAFNLILESSKNSLTSLQIGAPGHLGVQFPCLPNVKKLMICNSNSGALRIFPTKINLSKTFPNVSTLEILLQFSNSDESWDKYFPVDAFGDDGEEGGSSVLSGVKILKISSSCTLHWLWWLRRLVPNVSQLVLSDAYRSFNSMLRDVWIVFGQLEVLKFHCWRSDEEVFNLDSALTGISEGTIQNLMRQVTGIEKRHTSVMEQLRSSGNPSIRDLKCLKEFKIIVEGRQKKEAKLRTWKLMTMVSEVYAFSLMRPQLTVTIAYDHSEESSVGIWKGLLPLSPHVNQIDKS